MTWSETDTVSACVSPALQDLESVAEEEVRCGGRGPDHLTRQSECACNLHAALLGPWPRALENT